MLIGVFTIARNPHDSQMTLVLAIFCRLCEATIRLLLLAAVRVHDIQRAVIRAAPGLLGSLKKLLAERLARRQPTSRSAPRRRRRANNRIPAELEEKIVRLHVDWPSLGSGQLRWAVHRIFGQLLARETIRRVRQRNRALIAELEAEKRDRRRRIHVTQSRQLWGVDLTLVWVLGFFPLWLIGVVDYHGSRLIALEPVGWPRAENVTAVLDRAMVEHGAPARMITDRGTIFRSERFARMVDKTGVKHTLTRAYHPWTNGRIERLFRTFKETVRPCYWLVSSVAQWRCICRDFMVFYNEHRPHQSFGGRTPAEVERGSTAQLGRCPHPPLFNGRLHWWRFA